MTHCTRLIGLMYESVAALAIASGTDLAEALHQANNRLATVELGSIVPTTTAEQIALSRAVSSLRDAREAAQLRRQAQIN